MGAKGGGLLWAIIVRTVKAHLLRIADRRVDGKVVIIKVNRTDVIVKLAE